MIKPVSAAIRAGLVALLGLVLSATGHVFAGSARPGAGTLAAVAGCAWLLALAGARREWTYGRLLVVLGAAQIGAHLVFSVGQTTVSAPHSVAMALGHAAATIAAAGLLANADRLADRVRSLIESSAALWPGASALRPALFPAGNTPPLPGAPAALGSSSLVTTAPRRGPPA